MSRIGRKPIDVPAGVTVTLGEGNKLTVAGKLGTLEQSFNTRMTIKIDGNQIIVERPTDEAEDRAIHGLTRTLINNMVVGVSEGYSKTLLIVGVGYRAQKQGKVLNLNLGHSHPVTFEDGNGVTFETPDSTTIIVKGINKEVVGQIAAEVRSKRPPEPYLGKGVKYADEHIRRKAGKTGK